MDYQALIDKDHLPEHVAVIMDGNGRWAKNLGKPRIFGHRNGVKAVREISEAAAEIGISYLTLYAFSTENWNRPKLEVSALMGLLVETIRSEVKTLLENNISLQYIGDISKLPSRTRKSLEEGVQETSHCTGMTLTLALNYSARWDIAKAVKSIADKVKNGELEVEAISEDLISKHLSTHYMPNPELLIRTSGEHRISNYLLWEISYSELYFTDIFWPDFKKEHFFKAIHDFQNRERRFGKTSEQISSQI